MLFTAAGVDASFLKAVNHKQTVTKGMPPPTNPPVPASSTSRTQQGAMDMLTQAAAAAQPVVYY